MENADINLYFSDIMAKINVLRIDQFNRDGAFSDFYVNTIANHLVTSHRHIEKPHRHNFYATMLFTNGSGTHTIDFKQYKVSPGSLFTMAPGQIHHWELSPEADGWIFFHSADFYELRYTDERLGDYAFFSSVQPVQHFVLDRIRSRDIEATIQKMSELDINDSAIRNRFLVALITQVYLRLKTISDVENATGTTGSSVYSEKFRLFESLLERHFRGEKSAEKYAALLHMSAKHLNRINQLMLGKSTSEIIADRLILEAKRLLLHAKQPMSEIAASLGFVDDAYFSKFFKKRTGSTPSQFRANHR